MKYNAMDINGDLVAIVDADNEVEALAKAKALNSEATTVEERPENAHGPA